MNKHIVNWRKVIFTNDLGNNYEAELPEIIDVGYRGKLLSKILDMQKKTPIIFDDAVRMAGRNFFDSKAGHSRGESHWYLDNFVDWISEQGYHIDLTGDEFEPTQIQQKEI
jgi:hypothetical protein